MISEKKKQTIKLITSISILILLFLFVIIMMIKYEVEGEKNMPFELSKIITIGTVEGKELKDTSKEKWKFDIEQNNDVYFYIDKKELAKDELIKKVIVENITVLKKPTKGQIKVYMPNSEEGRTFVNEEQFLVKDTLEYRGAAQSSTTNLEIGSQGGTALIRFCNSNIGKYKSNKGTEVVHNSSLLKSIGVKNQEIKFSISFDFIIETTKTRYRAPITLDFPTGNLDEEENCYFDKSNTEDIIFKRIK